MPAACAELIVCEEKPRWVSALRVLRTDLPLYHCTRRDDCHQRLAIKPASIVALEITARNLPAVLHWLTRFDRRWPDAAAVALAEAGLVEFEPTLYEAGAVQVLYSLTESNPLAQLAGRHFAKRPPPRATGLLEQFALRLPWNETPAAENK